MPTQRLSIILLIVLAGVTIYGQNITGSILVPA